MAHGKACESCAAWDAIEPTRAEHPRGGAAVRIGHCRLAPPRNGIWPQTRANDWCLQYRAAHLPNGRRETAGGK